MSIINDALKRAQKNMAKKDTKKQPEKKPKTEKTDPPSTIKQAASAAKGPVYPTPISQQPKTPPPPAKKPAPEKPKAKAKKKKKKEKMWYQTISVIVAIFFLITGILIATLYFLKQRSSEDDGDRRSYQPKRLQRTYKPGELNLSGTSLIENRRVALINGDIYEEGDVVDGNKIISIELKKVALQDPDGKVIMLRVKKAD